MWWAERIDKIAAYEADHYKVFRPISVSSWPTLDALHHPTEGKGASEDSESLDLAPLDTSNYPAGYFASYHAYPYYPDWMNEDPNYVTARDAVGPDSYFGYLKTLRAHYYPKPLVVAEVGVPSSWGQRTLRAERMDHGGEDEVQQGNDDVRLFHNAVRRGDRRRDPLRVDRRVVEAHLDRRRARPAPRALQALHNVTSPEQNFGLLSFELDPPNFSMFAPTKGTGRVAQIRGAADAEYFHLEITLTSPLAATESLTIGYDTYADDRGESVLPNGVKTKQRSELALKVTPTSAELMVMEPYDQFGVWHDTQAAWHNKEVSQLPSGRPYRSIVSDGGKWNLVRWKNNSEHGSDDGVYKFPETVQEIGKLRVRKASDVETGTTAVVFDGAGTTFTVRIPWTLLQVTDPSDLRVLDDDPTTRDRETSPTDGFRIAVSIGTDLVETPRMRWQRWDQVPTYKERRKLSYGIFVEGLRGVPDR